MSKHPEEAMDLNYMAKTSKAWDEPNPREAERVRQPIKWEACTHS